MTDQAAARLPQAGTDAQNPADDAPLRRAAVKDLSLVTLVPKWSGTETSIHIQEIFEIIEASAAMSDWAEADKIRVCALKLTEAAREFYSANPKLREPGITW
jgi:hypothetical protein